MVKRAASGKARRTTPCRFGRLPEAIEKDRKTATTSAKEEFAYGTPK